MQQTRYAVCCEGKVRQLQAFPYGLRQGCPLSPWLYNVFADDLWDSLEHSVVDPSTGMLLKGLGYADDTVLLAASEADMSSQLAALDEWCERNNMCVNACMSAVLFFDSHEYAAPSSSSS